MVVCGGGGGVLGGLEAEGELNHPLAQGKSPVCLIKHKNSHSVHIRTKQSLGAV